MRSYKKKYHTTNKSKVKFGYQDVTPNIHQSKVRHVFESVADNYDRMNDLMSGGLHRVWKQTFLNRIQRIENRTLVDLAGGTGDIAKGFLSHGGNKAYICDISLKMLLVGKERDLNTGTVEGAIRICGDAATIPLSSGCTDVCTIVFGLRNVTHRQNALHEIYRILKPGGHFLCMEFSPSVIPEVRYLYEKFSFKIIPWLGEKVAGDRKSYEYLVESIRQFPAHADLSGEIANAGFKAITEIPLTGGIVWIHSGWRI